MAGLPTLLLFLLKSTVLGLAVAFLIVFFNPELLSGAALRGGADPRTGPASYADAVAASAPAVVSIYTERVVTEPDSRSILGRVPGYEAPLLTRIERSLGSGVIVSHDGYMLTNNHVVREAAGIRVQLADGRTADPVIVGADQDTDLAVLKIELRDLPVMPLGRSDTLAVGDVVLAIGNSFGLSQTVTQGIVSATGRGQLGVSTFENFIQTDAAINFGNSGGALVDSRGRMIGLNTAGLSRSLLPELPEGIGFAIPVNLAAGVLRQIVDHGRVIRGWLGAGFQNLTAQRAGTLGAPGASGIEVTRIIADSPAMRAGLRVGDVLTHFDRRPVYHAQDALNHIAGTPPGELISLRGLREGEAFTLDAKVAERPATGLQPER
ncbi:MAG TPA: trypsin-like peptidase domain-containing protein [Gammaproteobacteria bacterium]|nr:trypsin-like peptidase domain-containing protein [Gammaproteobacteria bacterium]